MRRSVRALLTAAAAAVCMLSCSLTCFAEGENVAVTTTTGTSAQGQGGVVWTQLTKDTAPADNDSVQISIDVSRIEDKKFTASVQVSTQKNIAVFQGSVGYEPSLFKLVEAKPEQAAGGQITDAKTDGKYSFTYSNPSGSSYSGNYITLSFELLGDEAKGDVLYLGVDQLVEVTGSTLNYNKADGIVNPSDSPKISLDVKTVRLAAFPRPYSFEELGFADAINCEIDESDIAKYSEGGIVAMTPGTVNASIIMKDYSKQKIKIEVYNTDASGDEIVPDGKPAEDKKEKELIKAKTSVNIGVPILLVIAAGFAYLLVSKNRSRRSTRRPQGADAQYDPRYHQQRYGAQRPRYDRPQQYRSDRRPPRYRD